VTERNGRRVAEFDLARSLPWLLAGSVRSLQLEKGVRGPERGEIVARLGGLESAGEPAADGDDWLFAAPVEPPRDPAAEVGRYVLTLLAPGDLAWLELPLEREPSGALRARGAARFERASRGPVEWTLEYRSGPHALARARGTVLRP
jgi:hypothetical protein